MALAQTSGPFRPNTSPPKSKEPENVKSTGPAQGGGQPAQVHVASWSPLAWVSSPPNQISHFSLNYDSPNTD